MRRRKRVGPWPGDFGTGARPPPGGPARRSRGHGPPGGGREEVQMLEAYMYYLELGSPIVLALIGGLAISKMLKSV